jgi:hypothetical protein
MEVFKECEDTFLMIFESIVVNLPVEAIIPGKIIVEESDELFTSAVYCVSRKLWGTGVKADFTILTLTVSDFLTLPVAAEPLV